MKSSKVDVAALLVKIKLGELVEQAKANLRAQGGDGYNATMLLQAIADDKIGNVIVLKGETGLLGPLTTALDSLCSLGFESSDDYVMVSVTAFDGPRFGQVNSSRIDLDDFIAEHD